MKNVRKVALFKIRKCVVAIGSSDIFFQKLLYTCLMPYAVLLAAASAWLSNKLICKKQILEKMLASIIIIIFMLQPSLIKIVFQAMSCLKLENGPQLIKRAPYLMCYDETHLKWVSVYIDDPILHLQQILFLYVPTLLIWILILPLCALLVIHRNRNQLDTPRMKIKYLFLYNGYTSRRYFWEFVIMYRKITMGLIAVFISDNLLFLKCMLLLMLLFLSILLQIKCKPYIKDELNQVDLTATTVSVATLYAGIFQVAQVPEENAIIFFITLVIANLVFLIQFGYIMFKYLYKSSSADPEEKIDKGSAHQSNAKLKYGSIATEKHIAHQLEISIQSNANYVLPQKADYCKEIAPEFESAEKGRKIQPQILNSNPVKLKLAGKEQHGLLV
eukprot:TRINITY_DN2940_c0_g3_i9.p1 TRINITY_DN2940_c0_g3~~TRINITY_DN2940_c0_g3_i9.p1  ORF type:complete len:388 (+),score=16.80 TRINITY_DN2940_c0_g3_i9:207-1370(+)